MKIHRIDSVRCTLGEGPVWDVKDQALYLLDIGQCRIVRYKPVEGSVIDWTVPRPPGALALSERGGAVVAIKDTLYSLNFRTGELQSIAVAHDQPPTATFNDGKTDRQGRFVIGSCCTDLQGPQPIGGIYSLGLDGSLRRLGGDISFSNSPCFSPDGNTLYFADSARYEIYSYKYNSRNGDIGERRCLVNTRSLGGMPDGATVDSDGLLWVAIFEGSKIAVFRPNGELERLIPLPISLPGSVIFGGPSLQQLFVATIDPVYFGRVTEEGAGYLYCIEDLGATGLAEQRSAN